SIVFCYSRCDHREVDSFPTRRSSDLQDLGGDLQVHVPHAPQDRLPGVRVALEAQAGVGVQEPVQGLAELVLVAAALRVERHGHEDRKSTRLNSSHVKISYAVFCLKKK